MMIEHYQTLSLFRTLVLAGIAIWFILAFCYWRMVRRKAKRMHSFEPGTLSHIASGLSNSQHFLARILRYYKKVRVELRLLFILSLSVYLLSELIMKPLVATSAFELHLLEVTSRLSVSFVSAFIFYFLVVHWQRQTDKENLQDHIGPLLQDLIEHAVGMMQPAADRIAGNGSHVDVFSLKRIEIIRAMEFYDTPTGVGYGYVNGEPAGVPEMVLYHVEQMKEVIKEVFLHYTLLDGELVQQLNVLKMSNLLRQPQAFMLGNKPSYLAEDQWTFLQRMQPLLNYSYAYPGRKSRLPSSAESDARMREHMPENLNDLLDVKPNRNIEWKLYWWVKRKRLQAFFGIQSKKRVPKNEAP